jgi:hypothetical protein
MSSNLEALFSSSARVAILRLFLLNPDSQFYQREIERETDQPIRAVQREVKRLAEVDLLTRSAEGNRVFYGLNPDFPLLAELTALFQRDSGVAVRQEVRAEGKSLPPEPSAIQQPFPWMETLPIPSLPPALRRLQMEREWDEAY